MWTYRDVVFQTWRTLHPNENAGREIGERRTNDGRRMRDVRVRYGPKSAAEAAAVGGAFGGALKTRRGGGGSSDGGDEGALLR